jgi:molybdate transport system substrate-binding protein
MKRLSFALLLTLLLALLAGCGAATTPAPTTAPVAPPTSAPLARTTVPPTALPPVTTPVPPAATPQAGDLTVLAAASLTDAFNEIGKNFGAANPGVKVVYSFAGSNALAAQIGQGAPADVFASANTAQMDVAVKTGRIDGNTTRAFARNRLVMIVAKGVAKVTKLQDLANPGLKVVLADKAVPVGQYALDYMDKAVKDPAFGAAYKDAVLKNVVSYEQDVKAVLAKVALGEADAGIVYTTDVLGANADKVQKIDIPDALNTLATYPIGVLTDSKNAALAKKFFDYVLSTEAQTVLAKYGFIPVTGNATGAAPGKVPVAISGLVDKPATLASEDIAKLP